jgi:hypothetical protein
MSEPKDIGKFPLTDDEKKTLGVSEMVVPQASSQAQILRQILDDLIEELEEIDKKRERILFRILTINALLTEKAENYRIAQLKRPA